MSPPRFFLTSAATYIIHTFTTLNHDPGAHRMHLKEHKSVTSVSCRTFHSADAVPSVLALARLVSPSRLARPHTHPVQYMPELQQHAERRVAKSASKVQLKPFVPRATETKVVQRNPAASPHLASTIDLRDVSDASLRDELRAEQPPAATDQGAAPPDEAGLRGAQAYRNRKEPSHRPGHPDKAIRTPLFLIPEPSRTGEVYITQTARMTLSDKQRSKAERVHRELEQLRQDIRQVDSELARIGPHDPKRPMKTSWASGGVLHGTSGTVGQVLNGASGSTLELINSYADSYTSPSLSMLAGGGAEADTATPLPTISPSGALSFGGHAPEMSSGLAPEHRFTQRGLHGGSTADFQASFLSAATPKVRPLLRPRTGGYARTPVGLAYEPPTTLLSNPTIHRQYPPHMANLVQPPPAVAQLRPPITNHQLQQQKEERQRWEQQEEERRAEPEDEGVTSEANDEVLRHSVGQPSQKELARQFDLQWQSLERAEMRASGAPAASYEPDVGALPIAHAMPRSRSAAVVGAGLHMPRSPLGLRGQHAASMHSIRNRFPSKPGPMRPALARPGSSAQMISSTRGSGADLHSRLAGGDRSSQASPTMRVATRGSQYLDAHFQRRSQQRFPRSPSGAELATRAQDMDEMHNVLDLPHLADVHGAQFAPVGESKITGWWFYSPEEAKAAHPIMRVSSEKSIGPRREWDPSCVEVLRGDLEDEDTPR
jgi:hypothetical protein